MVTKQKSKRPEKGLQTKLFKQKIYRTILAFEAVPTDRDPLKTPQVLFEIGVYIYGRTPTLPASTYRTEVKEALRAWLEKERGWSEEMFSEKFGNHSAYHETNSEVVNADEKPDRIPYGKLQRYMFFYDVRGGIKGDMAREDTKYDEVFFSDIGKPMKQRRLD